MTMTNPNDDLLDDLFAQARQLEAVPSDALIARVLADAAQPHGKPASVAQPGLWSRVFDMLGGWPAVSGLAAATVAGLWIGMAPPASVEALAASLIGSEISVGLYADDLWTDTGVFADG
jgi:hypothetical protein